MSAPQSGLMRWLKFNVVGAIGICVQLGTLTLLKSGLGLNYLVATALAVEVTIIHNFLWHERFTWAERTTNSRLGRFLTFNFSNGAISLVGNIALMKVLTGVLGLNYLASNFFAIGACSLVNFVVGDQVVFTQRGAVR